MSSANDPARDPSATDLQANKLDQTGPSARPSLNMEQARKRAKELIKALRKGDSAPQQRFQAAFPGLDFSVEQKLALHDAQRVIAFEHGFEDWGQLLKAADNQPLLTSALLGGQIDTVRQLLGQGANPNRADRWGVMPLRAVSAVKSPAGAAIVDLLVVAGADVNRESRGMTPLAAAEKAENEHVAAALKRHGGQVELRKDSRYAGNHSSEDFPFWSAVTCDEIERVHRRLTGDPSRANRDFRPESEVDPHTHRRPLVAASAMGHFEIVQLLLEHGADVNAKSPTEDQREFGMPLQLAVENGHYRVANLLLDHGASVDSYPYCDQPVVERLHELALAAGAPAELVRKGFTGYLGVPNEPATIADDAAEVVRLFDRVLTLGGQPTITSVIRSDNHELIRDLLQAAPHKPAPKLDYPPMTVVEKTAGSAAWHGYPEILDLCLEVAPEQFDVAFVRHKLENALVSHNRDGSWQEYLRLIRTQLELLTQTGQLKALQASDFNPHFLLADNYCWPRNDGYRADISTAESLLAIAELLVEFGFKPDLSYRHPEKGLTAIETVRQRLEQAHPGMKEYLQYLEQFTKRE